MPPATRLKEAQAFVIAAEQGQPQTMAVYFIDPSNQGRKMKIQTFAKNLLKVAPLDTTSINPDDINPDLVVNIIKMPGEDDDPEQQPIIYNVTLGVLLEKFLPKSINISVGVDVPGSDGSNYIDLTGVLDLDKYDVILMFNNGVPSIPVIVVDAGDDNKRKLDVSADGGMTAGNLILIYQLKLT